MKRVLVIMGIRPDFIRMSEVIKKLDQSFVTTVVHTGQHYDKMLSDVFFDELDIRKPDYNLGIGSHGKRHHEQLADLSVKIVDLIEREELKPDIILFLGDSNSVVCAVPLKKEGYRIGHIEAGMRSYDRRMLEEINRVVCDHCSDILFVYHEDYAENCFREGISKDSVFVVGNTIVEVCRKFSPNIPKKNDFMLVDIHRPENFNYPDRMLNILGFVTMCVKEFKIDARMLKFPRTMDSIGRMGCDTSGINFIDLMSYRSFLQSQYDSAFMISDSGTAQEEPSLLGTPVVVPRDFTERPQSMSNLCSHMVNVNSKNNTSWQDAIQYIHNIQDGSIMMHTEWLGRGKTSDLIIEML